jgi:hypothetical protein
MRSNTSEYLSLETISVDTTLCRRSFSSAPLMKNIRKLEILIFGIFKQGKLCLILSFVAREQEEMLSS